MAKPASLDLLKEIRTAVSHRTEPEAYALAAVICFASSLYELRRTDLLLELTDFAEALSNRAVSEAPDEPAEEWATEIFVG